MSFEVHREPLYRRYNANLFSIACCYSIAFGFLLIFLPLIIAYNSSNFWLKENVTYEQPSIQYRYTTITEFYGERSSEPLNLYYSTSADINKVQTDQLRIPYFRSAEFDDNLDGITDRLVISLLMPLQRDEIITGASLVAYCNVKIKKVAKYQFDGIIYANYESVSAGASSLIIEGDVTFRQTWALVTNGGYRVPYPTTEQLIPDTSSLNPPSSSDYDVSTLLSRSNARNFSLVFRPSYSYTSKRYQSQSSNRYVPSNSVPGHLENFFNVTLIAHIPIQPIRYTPAVSEVLKNAWIQYVAFFIVVAFLLFRMNSFIFRHELLHTFIHNDIVYEKGS